MSIVHKEYGITPNVVVDLAEHPRLNDEEVSKHDHVVIRWAGGEIWLDMSEQSDHFCIDIRQFNPDNEMKAQGYFTIVNGARGSQAEELEDTSGTVVQSHGWNGGYVATLITDKHGEEAATKKPSQGNG